MSNEPRKGAKVNRDAVTGRFVSRKTSTDRATKVDAAFKTVERKYGRTLTDLSK